MIIEVLKGIAYISIGSLLSLILFSNGNLKPDFEISVLDVLHIVVAIFLAFIIPNTVTKAIEDRKARKHLLVNDLNYIAKKLDGINIEISNMLTQYNSSRFYLLVNEFKVISGLLSGFDESMKFDKKSEMFSVYVNLKNSVFSARQTLTGLEGITPSGKPISEAVYLRTAKFLNQSFRNLQKLVYLID